MIAVVVGLVLLAAGLAWRLRPPALDPETLCPRDAPPPAHTVILIDATDALQPRHRRRLEAAVRGEAARLPLQGRLSVVSLRPETPREPGVTFSRCRPRTAAETNPILDDPAAAEARFAEAFAEPLARALRQAGGRARAGNLGSPIIDAIVAVAGEPGFADGARRLVLVSDLMERRPGAFSAYADPIAFESWSRSPDAVGRIAALEGVDVRIVPLDRPEIPALQAGMRERFWPGYFDAAGVRALVVDPS